jgi:hypothetical protein
MLMTILLIGRTSLPVRCHGLSSLFASLTKTAGVYPKFPFSNSSTLLPFHALFSPRAKRKPFTFSASALFLETAGVGVISLPIG